MKSIKNTIQVAVLVLFTVIIFNPSAAQGQFFYMENEDVGKPVKDFTLKVVNGEETSLEKFRDGKKAVVFFWATWCPHCRAQLGKLNKDRAAIEEKGVKIALVDVGESEAVVAKYKEKNNISLDMFLDENSEVSDAYGLIGVPTFYYVDEDGIVVDVQHSLTDDIDKIFAKSK
jgi:peroxiredoxin